MSRQGGGWGSYSAGDKGGGCLLVLIPLVGFIVTALLVGLS